MGQCRLQRRAPELVEQSRNVRAALTTHNRPRNDLEHDLTIAERDHAVARRMTPAELSGATRVEIDQQETAAIQHDGNAGMEPLEEPTVLDDDVQPLA